MEKFAAGGKPATLADVAFLIKSLKKRGPGFRARPTREVLRRIDNPIFHGSQWIPEYGSGSVRANSHPIAGYVDSLHFSPYLGSSTYRSEAYALNNRFSGRGYMDVVNGTKIPEIRSGAAAFKEADRPVSEEVKRLGLEGIAERNRRILKPGFALRKPDYGAFEILVPSRRLGKSSPFMHIGKGKSSASMITSEVDGMANSAFIADNSLMGGTGRLMALVKLRNAHPEFGRYIDPVISRYQFAARQGKSIGRPLYKEVGEYATLGATPQTMISNLPKNLRKKVLSLQGKKFSGDSWMQEVRDLDKITVEDMVESRFRAALKRRGVEKW